MNLSITRGDAERLVEFLSAATALLGGYEYTVATEGGRTRRERIGPQDEEEREQVAAGERLLDQIREWLSRRSISAYQLAELRDLAACAHSDRQGITRCPGGRLIVEGLLCIHCDRDPSEGECPEPRDHESAP